MKHICIRCNGSGSIWARPNRTGDMVPLADLENIGIGKSWRDMGCSMTSDDQLMPCDWCGGAQVVEVTPVSRDEAKAFIAAWVKQESER